VPAAGGRGPAEPRAAGGGGDRQRQRPRGRRSAAEAPGDADAPAVGGQSAAHRSEPLRALDSNRPRARRIARPRSRREDVLPGGPDAPLQGDKAEVRAEISTLVGGGTHGQPHAAGAQQSEVASGSVEDARPRPVRRQASSRVWSDPASLDQPVEGDEGEPRVRGGVGVHVHCRGGSSGPGREPRRDRDAERSEWMTPAEPRQRPLRNRLQVARGSSRRGRRQRAAVCRVGERPDVVLRAAGVGDVAVRRHHAPRAPGRLDKRATARARRQRPEPVDRPGQKPERERVIGERGGSGIGKQAGATAPDHAARARGEPWQVAVHVADGSARRALGVEEHGGGVARA
jgi:hypothetical protein